MSDDGTLNEVMKQVTKHTMTVYCNDCSEPRTLEFEMNGPWSEDIKQWAWRYDPNGLVCEKCGGLVFLSKLPADPKKFVGSYGTNR